MADGARLNGVIAALARGERAMLAFSKLETEEALALGASKYDGVIAELEHNPWDGPGLRNFLQFLLNRRLIAESGSVAPAVTPLVRIPANGQEKNEWLAKQALDLGAYGIVFPHVSTPEQAHSAVAACRYPRLSKAPLYEPAGLRGDSPASAARYWGLSQQDYYRKADVWPLAPDGEILVLLMIEDTVGIANLDRILREVPGIGGVLIGEGDLSQELGVPRQYEHPTLLAAMREVVAICKSHDVPVGHPHVEQGNVQRVIDEGYRILVAAPVRSFATLDKARALSGRT